MLKIRSKFNYLLTEGVAIETEEVLEAIDMVNSKLDELGNQTEALALNIFKVIDFRMLSGMVGEMLVDQLSKANPDLEKNPNIDGYPDLVNVSTSKYLEDFQEWKNSDLSKFIKYPYGGLEIKNTFGTKKSGTSLLNSERRISKVNRKPDWKAHHGYTNNLLALFSDFDKGIPKIVSALYADDLNEDDWTIKQNPAQDSTMTSFCVIKRSGWDKIRKNVLICETDVDYENYFDIKDI